MQMSAKFSVSMPTTLKEQVDKRKRERHPGSEDRSSVITRDLDRLYNGVLKVGLRTLKQARFTLEERACLVAFLTGTAFSDPASIPYLVYSLEESRPELEGLTMNLDAFFSKLHTLDAAALYALVDLLERDPALKELA